MISSVQQITEGRAAMAAHNYPVAFELLSGIDPSGLNAEDLDALGDAAWWLGRLDDCVSARERAFESYMKSGTRDRAAMAALSVSLALGDRGDDALAAGWFTRRCLRARRRPMLPGRTRRISKCRSATASST